ncbi:Guanylate kinase [Trichinella britovi]|uniref:guanylate kinase n=1 Tax=Trichinella britovi TaxID=45882 RepID=A0A0V1D8F9_TRIBR|nr:Guanylate kinase [Trichinella sp. T9]KRX78921.1 Guanylate kinase [Trichinella sp. T6]KRY57881.1 Guanylate kinase [Trichinella britovi]KRZ89393.1 Guanylate kinase [Trichinella sp. T8]
MSSRPVVVSGPSGCGKSTLLSRLFKEYPDKYALSVSHTTRQPRSSEQHGIDYYFSSKEEMIKAIERGEFLEHAEFSGNLYGTSFEAVHNVVKSGKTCILDLEIQGVRSTKNSNLNPLCILIKPPNLEELKSRLRNRGTETDESLCKRLKQAEIDMAAADKEQDLFDYIIINENLNEAYEHLLNILCSLQMENRKF